MKIDKSKQLLHFSERPANISIDTVVIHSMYNPNDKSPTSIKACFNILDECKVSAHYLIDRKGQIAALVDESRAAWHAGKSLMADGRERVNDFSIGIELLGLADRNFTKQQYIKLAKLVNDICSRYPIKFVVGHEHIAVPAGRKVDPGAYFDWRMLKQNLISLNSLNTRINFSGLS